MRTRSLFLLFLVWSVIFVARTHGWDEEDDVNEEESSDDLNGSAPMYGDYTDDDLWDEAKLKMGNPNMPQKIIIHTPFEDEIFSGDEVYLSFEVLNMTIPIEGSAIVYLNGGEVARSMTQDAFLAFPKMASGVYQLAIQLVNEAGDFIGVKNETHFEVVNFAPAETIHPDPPGAVGRLTNLTSPPPNQAYHLYSKKIQEVIASHQNPPDCGNRFLIWESWGIVGFGAQILGLRVALALGLESNRTVVSNPQHEAHLVKSEMKWRFGESGNIEAPWGEGLVELSPCTSKTNVMDSVRPSSWEDFQGEDSFLLVTGDIWGLANREHIFTMPSRLISILPSSFTPPNIFWWWTEVMGYLMRPGPTLSEFIRSQKEKMGWKKPIIGIHMRLGIDKNREAQRFPPSYYIEEARRIKRHFGINTIYICSDRKKAVEKVIRKYGNEFEIITQPPIDTTKISPLFSLLTDILLVAESDFPIFTFSSNFGQAVFLLNSFYNNHRPSYISMDDNYEGFKYYGWQLKLVRDPQTGVNEIMLIDCVNDKCTTQEQEMASGDHRVIGFDYVDKAGRIVNRDEL